MNGKKKIKFAICCVGSGGTGSYFLKEFSRYLYDNKKALSQIYSLSVVDGDMVEKKNISRQAFLEEDVNEPKAGVMASVLNDAFDLKWKGYAQYILSTKDLEKCFGNTGDVGTNIFVMPVMIGCVDNHAARLVCEEYFNKASDCIYFDSANEFSCGEVVFAVKRNNKLVSPLRSTVFPDILSGDLRNVEELSCTELNDVAPQHIAANMQAGLILLSAITGLLDKGIVSTGMVIFDAACMSSKQYPTDHFLKEGDENGTL